MLTLVGGAVGLGWVPDTALPTFHFLARLEMRLGLPILSANAVTVWDALRLAGATWQVPGYGRLLSGGA